MSEFVVSNPGGCNIRSSPVFGANIVGGLKAGEHVQTLDETSGEWIPIQLWVHKTMLVPLSDVPYHSQWATTASIITSDCGEACSLMLAQSVGKAKMATIDDCVRLISNYDGFTSATDLTDLLDKLKVRAVLSTELNARSICLVNYSKFPPEQKQDKGYMGLHWVVAVKLTDGSVTYHDPDFWGDMTWQGANRSMDRTEFRRACTGTFICIA